MENRQASRKQPFAIQSRLAKNGCDLNGWTQHLVLDAKNGVYVEEAQEPSIIQGGKATGPLEASGIAGLS